MSTKVGFRIPAIALVVLAAWLAGGCSGNRAFFSCVPVEVGVFDNRAHVLCAKPREEFRGGYPKHDGDVIRYFAVPLSDPERAGRFIQLADIALAGGRILYMSYTPDDDSAKSFGCDPKDCREPWAFALR